MKARQVNYAWVSIVSDVDWEGNDVCNSLGAALRQAAQEGVKPYVGPSDFSVVSSKGKGRAVYDACSNWEDGTVKKVVPFERTPAVMEELSFRRLPDVCDVMCAI
ncbi:hypothetical protein SERLADRAFT_381507 [Serpula lacrymans var. lacrymans S7.9]|uniref:Uncharacterized protein n=1 Tax=Serpula lacrymans var. lacrymans (strain S7.9) TaxID=578457 RepID=F8NPH2_SERL9|nr:uncharacterized protein SERLADRAFT_381507 [Serpula lacrymans var. lacrymans S7.9]EGO27182.1 hypothetical protein SERLADRAFT_381507 [Serpula lacrymans var. lacrymans S7.9]